MFGVGRRATTCDGHRPGSMIPNGRSCSRPAEPPQTSSIYWIRFHLRTGSVSDPALLLGPISDSYELYWDGEHIREFRPACFQTGSQAAHGLYREWQIFRLPGSLGVSGDHTQSRCALPTFFISVVIFGAYGVTIIGSEMQAFSTRAAKALIGRSGVPGCPADSSSIAPSCSPASTSSCCLLRFRKERHSAGLARSSLPTRLTV